MNNEGWRMNDKCWIMWRINIKEWIMINEEWIMKNEGWMINAEECEGWILKNV